MAKPWPFLTLRTARSSASRTRTSKKRSKKKRKSSNTSQPSQRRVPADRDTHQEGTGRGAPALQRVLRDGWTRKERDGLGFKHGGRRMSPKALLGVVPTSGSFRVHQTHLRVGKSSSWRVMVGTRDTATRLLTSPKTLDGKRTSHSNRSQRLFPK